MAELAGSATDTAYVRAIPPLLNELTEKLNGQYQSRGIRFTLTPVGAYRAALDNENAARRDMRTAILLTTVGIAFLLIITFPRPLIGLLALLPSTAGAIFALLVCSFLFPSLSILAVSFGGAIMAFTVDLGITYLLFLDRPCEVSGRQAAREVQTAEILAALTTIGGFLLLLLSRFRVLAEIGVFAALGVAFAFAFVHWIFPRIFPVMPPALKTRNPWLGRILDRIALSGGKAKLAAAALFFGVMLFFARPVFLVDINAMNSLSARDHRRGQDAPAGLGGPDEPGLPDDRGAKPGGSPGQKRPPGRDVPGGSPPGHGRGGLLPFPTSSRGRSWRGAVRRTGRPSGRPAGWRISGGSSRGRAGRWGSPRTPSGPSWTPCPRPPPAAAAIPEKFAGFLGIAAEKSSRVQVSMVTPGPAYDAEPFFARYAATNLVSLFDAGLFNRRLGEVLVSLFTEIAVITGLGIILVVFLFFLDWRLSLIVLAPVAFALVSTLGTLKLLGRPVDIPGIMLWIVIMGMGIDYGIYYVCSYQRYLDERHPSMGLIRQAMFLAGATTLIGFGVLAVAQHAVLKSIGLTSLLGIAYSLVGAFLIVPPLVKRALVPVDAASGSPRGGVAAPHRADAPAVPPHRDHPAPLRPLEDPARSDVSPPGGLPERAPAHPRHRVRLRRSLRLAPGALSLGHGLRPRSGRRTGPRGPARPRIAGGSPDGPGARAWRSAGRGRHGADPRRHPHAQTMKN